jgi:hypothetical protein
LMRDPQTLDSLIAEIRELNGVSRVTGLTSEAESEI